jgi:hypothetical protein
MHVHRSTSVSANCEQTLGHVNEHASRIITGVKHNYLRLAHLLSMSLHSLTLRHTPADIQAENLSNDKITTGLM